jgi:hypothetical protein
MELRLAIPLHLLPFTRKAFVYRLSSGFFSGLALPFMVGSGQVTTRRTIRRTAIKVQLRMTFMDVCCGPPNLPIAAGI